MSTTPSIFSSPGPEQQFFDFLRDGHFMLQRDRANGKYFFYPRAIAPQTGSTDWEWVEASGMGTVFATSVVRRRPEKGGDLNVSLIDLAEGPRMMSNVFGIPATDVMIGMPVKAVIREVDGEYAVYFGPGGNGLGEK